MWRVTRVRMFELGHSFETIDRMSMKDVGDVVGYWSGKTKGESKLRKRHKLQKKN